MRRLLSGLGLVPAEHSSGRRIRRGEITRAGNAHARAVLVEAGWCYRLPAREERRYLERVAGLLGPSGRGPHTLIDQASTPPARLH